jgi:excisionase family DNA binding protein
MLMNIYTPEQAAKLLQITRATLLEYARDGRITGSKVARKWRFTDRDIEQFLERNRPARHTETTPMTAG